MDALTMLRDRRLAELADRADQTQAAIEGGSLLRTVAYLRWCPSCRDDDHFNHAERETPPKRGVVPPIGACWTLGNGEPCTCPWRPPSTFDQDPLIARAQDGDR